MFVYLHSRSTGAVPDSVPGRSDDTGDADEGGADFRLGLCCTGTDGFSCWSDGRVARQRSAKPCTAVRIRFRPHRNRVVDTCNAVFVLSLRQVYRYWTCLWLKYPAGCRAGQSVYGRRAQSVSASGEVEAGALWRRQVVSVTDIRRFFSTQSFDPLFALRRNGAWRVCFTTVVSG